MVKTGDSARHGLQATERPAVVQGEDVVAHLAKLHDCALVAVVSCVCEATLDPNSLLLSLSLSLSLSFSLATNLSVGTGSLAHLSGEKR